MGTEASLIKDQNSNPAAYQDPKRNSKQLLESLPPDFREAVSANTHLFSYLQDILAMSYTVPAYYTQLSRSLMNLENINVIYPVGGPLFIHVYSEHAGARAMYHCVEPIIPLRSQDLLHVMGEAVAYRIKEDFEFKVEEEHIAKLKEILASAVSITNDTKELGEFHYDDRNRVVYTNEETYKVLEYTLIKNKVGLGVIDPLIKDSYIEDISCDGVGSIFIEHRIFSSCETTINFDNKRELDSYVKTLSERSGRPATFRRPIIDAVLPDGSRLNLVFGEELSLKGSNFTIRKFAAVPLSITQLCTYNTMDFMEAAYLWMLLEEGYNVWVCGETASGKTTTLKSMCTFIKPEAKVLTIEDTPEVILPHDNWIREATRQGEDEASSIGIFELLKSALRQRPNYIIVGEIRGKEGLIAFQAMQTGHGVMATFHASSVLKMIQRLTGYPIEVPKTYIDILNAVVIQSAVRNPKTGKPDRRVMSISEIVGYDPVEQSFNYVDLFKWNPTTDDHEFAGIGTSYLLEERLAMMRGISRRDVRKIYDELESRAEILRILAKREIFDYYEVWSYIKQISGLGIEKSLSMLKNGEM